jgi:Flp pilus assembly protein TadD
VTAGLAYFLIRDHDRAETQYREAIRLDPDHGPANNNLAVLLVAGRRLAEAVPHLRIAIREKPDDPGRHVNLGKVLLGTLDLSGARQAFRTALELDADSVEARRGLATIEQLELNSSSSR